MSITTLPKPAFTAVQKAIGNYADTKLNELFNDADTVSLDRDALAELLLSGSDGIATLFRQGRNTKSGKKMKDPNAPKRATSAYLLWLNANREEIISEHFGEQELTGRDKVSKVGKKAGELWNAMSEDDKADYVAESKKLQEEYKAAMAEYKPTESYSTKPSNLDFDALPDAPVEWTGPFNGKKLRSLANGGKLGVGKFYSFEEAVKAAVEIGEECSGITYEAKFGKYSLRKKFEWCGDGVEGEDCSWVRGEIEVSKPKATKPKATKPKATKPKATKPKAEKPKAEKKPKKTNKDKVEKPKKSKKSKKAEVVSFTVNAPAEIEVETMTFGTPEPEKKVETKKSKKLAVAPEPEPEVVEESEEEDEEVSVRRWNYQGKQYLLDDASGEVYDIETQEVIGTLQEDGTVEFDE
jgi:hypothetical protein